MKLNNKFFWIKCAVVGLTYFSGATDAARYTGISIDPRLELTSRFAPAVQEGLIQGGNYLWNNEVEFESNKVFKLDFKEEDEFSLVERTTWDKHISEIRELTAQIEVSKY